MKMDSFLPRYHFREVHTEVIMAPSTRIFEAINDVTPDEIPWLSILFSLRALPSHFLGRTSATLFRSKQPCLEQLLKGGFILLEDRVDQELVLGTVGQFWKLFLNDSSLHVPIVNAREFLAFDRSGYAKSVINFSLKKCSKRKGIVLRTETRVWIPDLQTRLKFACYWLLISGGSGLLRRIMLRAIKRRAEQEH